MFFRKKQDSTVELPDPDIDTEKVDAARQELGELLPITKVKSKGLLNIGSHKVTGVELNRTISELEFQLSHLKKIDCNILDSLEQISTFTAALDQEYLTGLVNSATIAEDAAAAARKACEESGQNMAQIQILVEKVKDFKQKLVDIQHLYDVDQLWANQEEQQESFRQLESSLQGHMANLDRVSNIVNDIQTQDMVQQRNADLSRKLRISYILAGSSAFLTVFHLLLNIAGIL